MELGAPPPGWIAKEDISPELWACCKPSGAQPGGLPEGSRGSRRSGDPRSTAARVLHPGTGCQKPTRAPVGCRLLASLRDADARRRWTGGLAALRPPATFFHPSGMEFRRPGWSFSTMPRSANQTSPRPGASLLLVKHSPITIRPFHGEGVGQVADFFHGASRQQNFHDVKADFYGGPVEQGQVVKPRAGQPPGVFRIDGRRRAPPFLP